MRDWNSIAKKIVAWLKEQVKEANADGVVLGMSGGLDSSAVAVLCKKAFSQNSLALIMPCESSGQDMVDAKEFAEKIGIKYMEIDLAGAHKEVLQAIGEKGDKIAAGNLKARLRMCALYFFANKLNYLVTGTGNRSEIMLGYFTKYGDGAVDLLPLGGLLKTEVRELAKVVEVPEKILSKVPSAGLWEGQTDEGELGISYEKIDEILENISQGKEASVDAALLEKIKKRMHENRHKREQPKVFQP